MYLGIGGTFLELVEYHPGGKALEDHKAGDSFAEIGKAAKRVMDRIVKYLEEHLNLPVNKEKSWVSEVKNIPFLGFQILWGKIRVSDKARIKFKRKVRELTRRNNPLSMYQNIQELNKYLQGWVAYFGIQEFKKLFGISMNGSGAGKGPCS